MIQKKTGEVNVISGLVLLYLQVNIPQNFRVLTLEVVDFMLVVFMVEVNINWEDNEVNYYDNVLVCNRRGYLVLVDC